MAECQFDGVEPALVAKLVVEPHQGEDGLSLVIDGAKFLPGFEARECQDMAEGTGLFVLHEADAGGEPFHQLVVPVVIEDAGIFGQRQDCDGVSSELDLVIGLDEKSGDPAIGQKRMDDQVARQAGNRLADCFAQQRGAGQFVGFDHGIGGAGMAKRVVGADLPVEAGMIAVDKATIGADLPRQEFGTVVDK